MKTTQQRQSLKFLSQRKSRFAGEAGASRFVHVSTVGACDMTDLKLVDETAPLALNHSSNYPRTKAADLLGWEPRVTYEEGMKRTLEWLEKEMSALFLNSLVRDEILVEMKKCPYPHRAVRYSICRNLPQNSLLNPKIPS